jgi:PAS domain S-box-containing protein
MNAASEQEIKVLILEDEPTDAELVERTLRKAGLTFVTEKVATRPAFVEALDRFKPDIVLSDYKLPDFDGLAALMLVRRKDPQLPVIEVTGFIGDEAAVELIKAGANDYVLKDHLERLPYAIQRALAEVQTQRARDRAEEALHETAARLEDAQQIAEVGSWEWIPETDTQLWSEEVNRIFGRDPSLPPPTHEDFLAHMHPDDRTMVRESMDVAFETRTSFRIEARIIGFDGGARIVDARGRFSEGKNGGPSRLIGTALDITQRKQAEQVLRESEERFRAQSTAAQDAMITLDERGRVVFWNQSASRIFGYTAQEALGQDFHKFLAPARYQDAIQAAWLRFAESGEGAAIGKVTELAARRKDAAEFPIELSLSAVKIGGHWHALGVVRDITERKRAEGALQRLNRTLRTLGAANSSLVRATTEQELLNDMCRVCVDVGGYRLAWIGFVAHDEARTMRPVAWAGEHTEYVQQANITWADTERGLGPTGTAVRTGQAQISQNIEANPALGPWRADLLGFGFKSIVSLPLKNDSEVFGAVTLLAGEADAFGPDEVDLLKDLVGDLAYGIQARRDRAGRETAAAALDEALKSTVQAVANAVEMRDIYTAGHERHVAELAVAIARELGLTEFLIEGLYLAGLIHDVGKINVPAEYLSKPGKLTALEYQLIQTHVQAGYDIIKDVNFPWPVAQTILQHHERLDGSGYPNHLKGAAISTEGRILGVADVVDAMQSHRPYRPALGLDAALAEIEAGKGRLYDPKVVEACVALFRHKGFRFK